MEKSSNGHHLRRIMCPSPAVLKLDPLLDGNLDQWPHLNKLIQCYKTDLIKDDTKYGHYESTSPFSFQNKILGGLHTETETYLANAKGKTKIEDTIDDSIPSTSGRRFTEHYGESPLSSYEPAFDWENKRSMIVGQRIPETYMANGLKITVKVLSLSIQVGLIEPFYGTICLFNKERREQLSENFIFRVLPTEMQDGSTSHEPRGIFYLDAPSASVCLLIQIEKAAIEEGRWTPDPYSHKGQVPMKESEKQKRQAWSRIMPYKEPFAWAFVPLFESNIGPASYESIFPRCPLSTGVFTSGSQHGVYEPNAKTSVVVEVSNLNKVKEGYTEDSLQDPKHKVHKPMRGALKLEIEKLQAGCVNFKNVSGSGNATHRSMFIKFPGSGSDRAPGNADVIADDFQAFDFRTTARDEPFVQLFHCLYVYPLTVSLSQKRNLFIRVELRKDDADTCTQPLEAMHSREPHASLQKWVHTQVAVGARAALFHDEIKVSLPAIWAPVHHLRFTFFHIDLQTKLEAPKPVVIGYASLPLSTHAQLRSDISLPIMRELAPHYLQNSVKEKLKYLEDGKSVFKLRLRLCSSLYPINEHIRDFFLQYDRHILCPSPPWESELPNAIEGLKNADSTALLQFLHPILNMLLHIIAICVEKLQVPAFRAIIDIWTLVQQKSGAEAERNIFLVNFVDYVFDDGGGLQPPLYHGLSTVWRCLACSKAKGFHVLEDDILARAWFFFELIIKSMELERDRLLNRNLLCGEDVPQMQLKEELFLRITQLYDCLLTEVHEGCKSGLSLARRLNSSLAFFCYDLLSIIEPRQVFELVSLHLDKFSGAYDSVLHDCKLTFLQILCDHKLFVELPGRDPSDRTKYNSVCDKKQEFSNNLHWLCNYIQEIQEGRKGVMLLLEGSQDIARKAQEQASARVKCLEEDLAKLRSEVTSLRSERDKLALEANFAHEKFDRFMKEFEHQRDETNGVIARNVEFSQLIIDYQRKMREFSESSHDAEEIARKLTMEVSILKLEKEMLVNSEKRACDEVRSLSERVHRLQATLDTIQSTEEVREEARGREIRKKEEYLKQIEREWAEAKKELQEERYNVRSLTLERENAVKSAMRQVEEMGKELANALHAVTAAEARATVAETRFSDLEKKIKCSETKVLEKDEECGPSSTVIDEGVADLRTAKDEIAKLREEAQVNKDHMLQYKSIAQVNESALKQIEVAHENFKVEADRVKKSLEAELSLLRERVNELESDCSLKTEEAASAAAGQEEALAASFSEIASLKDELSVKTSQIVVLETKISAMKDDLEKEHQRWRTAQANYERQVILQSETIQELTKASQALSSLQVEASELRKLTEFLKNENKELKARWETEKSILDEAKNEAEKKYNEINEQNMILHSRLEALHIKLAETERVSGGTSSGSMGQDLFDDAGLQNVVNYLRRSKEIAETEISLLKQEKLRLQSQLESALKAAETAQASLRAERTNSRASLFTEEEFKSLQFQVREINLLRESNVQLREENKHNFDECQKLREAAQNARIETEKLENLLAERQTEVDACKKEIEIQKTKNEFLEKRVDELLERCKNIDVEDYDRMIRDYQQMQVNVREKDAQVEEIKKLVSEKQEVISRLEQDLARSRTELNERDGRINDVLQLEASLKSDVEKQKKLIAQFKKKSDVLLKEREDLSKENQALSKQLDDYRQGRRITEALGEQAMREKEKEKDTRIQMLEKTVERLREELRKDKDDHRTEKTKRLKIQKTISDSYETVTQGKTKLVDELEKHKQALKTLSDEVEKLKNSKSSQTEGTSVVQLHSGTLLDDLAAAYLLAVDNFERVANPIFSETGPPPPPDSSSALDTSSVGATTDHGVPALTPPSVLYAVTPASSSLPSAKIAEERERKVVLPKANVETRKSGRKLIRPRIARPEEPHADTEMSDIEGVGKTLPLFESQGIPTQQPSGGRKRQSVSSSTSELQEESQETIFDAAAPPLLKKSKGSQEPLQEGGAAESRSVEIPEILPAAEESVDDVVGDSSSPQGVKDEAVDEVENAAVGEQEAEEAKADSHVDLQNDGGDVVVEESLDSRQNEMVAVTTDDQTSEQDIQQQLLMTESGSSEREEGELVPDVAADVEGGGAANISSSPEIGEVQPGHVAVAVAAAPSPGVDEEPVIAPAVIMEIGEINSPQAVEDDKNDGGDVMEDIAAEGFSDKLNDGSNDQVAVETTTSDQQVHEAATGTGERASSSSISAPPGTLVTPPPPGTPVTPPPPAGETEVRQQQQGVGKNSTTINLHERARQRSLLRQAGVISQSPGRGRGRTPRGRATRGGRGGRGQPPSE